VIALWLVVGLVVAGVILVVTRDRGGAPDLGVVSHQWIAEHRLGYGEDTPRR
jgi:hypothetical protein